LERAREKTLSALGRLSLSDALVQLKTVFESQKTEEGRLANLSAQTWILRRRLEALRKGQPGPDVQSFMQTNPEGSQKLKLLALRSLQPVADPSAPAKDASVAVESLDVEQKSWQRVRIVAEAEVNGMVFFEGSMIAVKVEDAGRLVAAGKAEIVEEPSTHEPPPPLLQLAPRNRAANKNLAALQMKRRRALRSNLAPTDRAKNIGKALSR
jgi:hypothetical protein